MGLFHNADVHTRHWNTLQHPETHTTLELEPGEEVELDLPADFEDDYLKPVQRRAPRQAPPTTEATEPAEPKKEEAG